MANKSIGFIETFGLAACVAAADAAVKSANVKLLGYEYAKGGGMCTVKVEGNVGACKAAIEAGKRAAEAVNGTLSGTKSVLLKARPADGMFDLMVNNRETVGGEIALAEGYRPKGDTKKAVLVKNWKPAEEPKAEAPIVETPIEEAPIEEAPVTPVEEDLKEEAEEEDEADPESQEPETEAPVEEIAEEAKAEEIVETEEVKAEDPAEVKPSETETPKKSTSTGNRKKSRKRKKSDD